MRSTNNGVRNLPDLNDIMRMAQEAQNKLMEAQQNLDKVEVEGVSGGGLVKIDLAQRKIVGRFVLGGKYQGGGGMAHGGIIAVLLDEAMGKVCRFRDARAVTAQLTVDYLKPIDVEQEIVVEAFEEQQSGRNLFMVGEIRNLVGDVLARGKGRFVVVRQAHPGGEPEKKRVTV